jgi:hypothetical protein
VSPLLALLLAAAPGCPEALAAAAGTSDEALADRGPALARALQAAGAGPTDALAAAAAAISGAAGPRERQAAASAFRGALERHCTLAAVPPGAEASPADRAALAEVLARPELARSRARLDPWALRRALVRFWDWLVEKLATAEAERWASLGRALFLGAAAAALVLLLATIRRRWRAPRGDAAAPDVAGPGAAAPEASAALAEEALRRGETREAVRLALLAALAALEQAGRVPRGRALTNDEIVRLAGPPTATAVANPDSDLALLARAFDRAVYGGLPVAPTDARMAVERARRVAAGAGATP